ncbi:MAG: hypothetical protein USCAAHI_01960 [Beijerinckiaceae bacterium]|nr:MAG: hypothetical protein USCAAHI_01960 [Beijerinckiaceae bacterium]
MNSSSISPKNTDTNRLDALRTPAVVCFLFLGFLGYMWFKNLPTG